MHTLTSNDAATLILNVRQHGVTVATPVLLLSPASGSAGRAGLSDWEACALAASRACPVRSAFVIWAGHWLTGIRAPIISSRTGSSSASDFGRSPLGPSGLAAQRGHGCLARPAAGIGLIRGIR